MKYELIDYNGDANIGIFFKTSENFSLVPKKTSYEIKEKISRILKTEVIECSIWDTSLIGILCCLNSNGLLLPKTIFENEINFFKSLDLNVDIIDSDFNALGNLILCNDKAALVSPLIEKENLKIIRDVLDVEVEVGKILKNNLIASVAYVTNKGILFNRNIEEEEAKKISEFFRVKKFGVGSVNMGNIYVSVGIVANSSGMLLGSKTSPYEIQAAMEAFDF
ncbi:MAG: translation initiation factor IF-6 [Candidatus Aenigmatarchaeota archaeon]